MNLDGSFVRLWIHHPGLKPGHLAGISQLENRLVHGSWKSGQPAWNQAGWLQSRWPALKRPQICKSGHCGCLQCESKLGDEYTCFTAATNLLPMNCAYLELRVSFSQFASSTWRPFSPIETSFIYTQLYIHVHECVAGGCLLIAYWWWVAETTCTV